MSEHDRRAKERLRSVIDQIVEERDYQLRRWDTQRDQHHAPEDWLGIMTVWLGKVASECKPYNENPNTAFKKRVAQLAAICAAALENLEG